MNVSWNAIGEVLVLLLVVSIVFEVALSAIFNWRYFAKHCEGKGVKTPLTVVAAVALMWGHDLDIFGRIIAASSGSLYGDSTLAGRIMTGLLIAGGSGAVYSLFTNLKMRNPTALRAKAEEAREGR